MQNVDRSQSTIVYTLHDGPWKVSDPNGPVYSEAAGVICMFSLDSRFTHRDLVEWAKAVDMISSGLPWVVVGNKSDIKAREVKETDVTIHKRRDNCKYVEASMKDSDIQTIAQGIFSHFVKGSDSFATITSVKAI